MSIQSFDDPEAENFFYTGAVGKKCQWANIQAIVRRKLDMLHYAEKLDDLKSPPGNRLEALKGELSGYYSIRINDQWRCIFAWEDGGPTGVYVDDYH